MNDTRQANQNDNAGGRPVTDDISTTPGAAQPQPRWQPIGAVDRRVVGVLAEKAKTTPDAYPLSLNAIRNACNQKSNRCPLMTLDLEEIQESLERLRLLGAIGVVEGYGRVPKFRHYLYEWLSVDKIELAVMAELLLRGAQTEGELRGRTARMEPVADLAALRPVLATLKSKGLLISLTPEGRGHVVTHALYEPGELDDTGANAPRRQAVEPPPGQIADAAPPAMAAPPAKPEATETLGRDIAELRSQVAQLRSDTDDLIDRHRRFEDELRKLKDALGG